MARKRSRNSGGGNANSGSSVKSIQSYEDTLDEGGVDDFMFKRDQISFNPQNDSDDDDINADMGEEVLGLNVQNIRGGNDDEEDEEDDEDDESSLPTRKQRKQKVKPDYSAMGRFGKDEVDSDEDMDSDDDDDDDESGSESGSEDDEEGWGRQYYSRPSTRREKEKDDVYDEKREEERDLEEKEVRRLQRKAREALAGAEDWGLDDVEVEQAEPVLEETEKSAPLSVPAPDTDDPAALIRHLQSHEPLKLALARDFPLVIRKLKKTARGIKAMEEEAVGQESLHKGLGWLHYQTLLTYAATLAFYIHLLALPDSERPDMSSHPILPRLLQLKEGLTALEDLDFAAGSVSDAGPELYVRDDMLGDDDEDEEDLQSLMAAKRDLMSRMNEASGTGLPDDYDLDGMDSDEEADAYNLWHQAGLEDDELDDLLADAERDPIPEPKKKRSKRTRGKKSKAADKDEVEDGPSSTVTFTPMAEPSFVASTKKSRKAAAAARPVEEDTMGDATSLDDADATDKERRKRSLRFHTSKINATAARRSAARDKRMGGDDDIPYRDRQAARDAALRKNGPKRNEGEDLDGSEWTESDHKRAREVRDEMGDDADAGDDGYYNLVKRRKVEKEDEKAAAHEAFREAKFASFEDETADGPRALTRAIEKNRGLTPRRNKAGRNPRVKKRQAFEKAKQKVGSQRAVYKGGQSTLTGAYAGEKSGISTTIKSSRFK